MSVTLYGIKNCDSIRKARKWLDNHDVPYTFHDFRVDGIDEKLAHDFLKQINVEVLVNKRGTTWRRLSEQEKQNQDETKIIALMLREPAVIKRPILKHNEKYIVGFSETIYTSLM